MFINFSRNPADEQHHGKAVLLNPADRLCPIPAIFLIHEWRVRGRWPFLLDRNLSPDPEWLMWLAPFVDANGVIIRDPPTASGPASHTLADTSTGADGFRDHQAFLGPERTEVE